MSDGFDKEAEREKLREKFADDEEERAHTQRMSELLLQGATMTNRHCDDCGDPIFRKDGQEFCPTCHTVDAEDAADAGSAAAGQSPASEADGESPSAAGEESPPVGENGATRPGGTDPRPDPAGRESPAERPDPPTAPPESPATESAPAAGGSADGTAAPANGGSGSVADARASLTRTLHRFAAAAEETDDPRRARDRLQAAREAAEALAALDR
ncbi:Sjogren's syndrome/scleroderma autoantigen 1 family protein [Halorubrum rutilum]|uniref:Sjogren's syndrome/scleroderma autoantigen 1 family protein n=1 Tax=Halorubrum rutilum TaxID=1364933 RepID=A0ABD6AGW5_9EURY|nr:Sjogren's syndrome/scleroderma autoantigen 1 family protein [Halorubrum rutilum]